MSITDFFIATDFYRVTDTITGNVLNTALLGALPPLFPIGDPNGNLGWTNAAFSKGTMVLAPGAHNLEVTWTGKNYAGNPVFPAGFYTRLDVPEPATLALLSMGLLGWGVMRRKAAV